MKDKTELAVAGDVFHRGYEGQKAFGWVRKCPSESQWRTKQICSRLGMSFIEVMKDKRLLPVSWNVFHRAN